MILGLESALGSKGPIVLIAETLIGLIFLTDTISAILILLVVPFTTFISISFFSPIVYFI